MRLRQNGGAGKPGLAVVTVDCEIRVRGTLTGDWSLPDQAALFGILASIRNLNLQLISVRVEATPTGLSGKEP